MGWFLRQQIIFGFAKLPAIGRAATIIVGGGRVAHRNPQPHGIAGDTWWHPSQKWGCAKIVHAWAGQGENLILHGPFIRKGLLATHIATAPRAAPIPVNPHIDVGFGAGQHCGGRRYAIWQLNALAMPKSRH